MSSSTVDASFEKSPYYHPAPSQALTWTLRALLLIGVAGAILGGLGFGGEGIPGVNALGSGLIVLGGALLILMTALMLCRKKPKTTTQFMEEHLALASTSRTLTQKTHQVPFVDGTVEDDGKLKGFKLPSKGDSFGLLTLLPYSKQGNPIHTACELTVGGRQVRLFGVFDDNSRQAAAPRAAAAWRELLAQYFGCDRPLNDETVAQTFIAACSAYEGGMGHEFGGTTATCALVADDTVYIPNVGSSRALLVRREGVPMALTVQTNDMISAGNKASFEFTKIQRGVHFQAGDFLILATTSLWSYASDQEVSDFVKACAAGRDNPSYHIAGNLLLQLQRAVEAINKGQSVKKTMRDSAVVVIQLQ